MRKSAWILLATAGLLALGGCATMGSNGGSNPDQTVERFFEDLQRSDNTAAYSLLAKGISQRISFDQFDGFMQTIREQWGRIETYEIATYPFHVRAGEQNFIPLRVEPKKVKRYTYTIKFETAEMNFDLTLAPEADNYRIVWFSVWGSSVYVNGKIEEKVKELFSGAGDEAQPSN